MCVCEREVVCVCVCVGGVCVVVWCVDVSERRECGERGRERKRGARREGETGRQTKRVFYITTCHSQLF